ncbi:MAG TPA: hypothetical protein VHC90_20535 [Bryobacteraceae bacterium]|nr:hypothetical protein [Bryobacteraceae bacterium]
MSGKELDEFYRVERYRNVDEYDPVLRWHCRLDEPKPKPVEEKETSPPGEADRQSAGRLTTCPTTGVASLRSRP